MKQQINTQFGQKPETHLKWSHWSFLGLDPPLEYHWYFTIAHDHYICLKTLYLISPLFSSSSGELKCFVILQYTVGLKDIWSVLHTLCFGFWPNTVLPVFVNTQSSCNQLRCCSLTVVKPPKLIPQTDLGARNEFGS